MLAVETNASRVCGHGIADPPAASPSSATAHEEVVDLVEGFFTPSSTDAHNREIIISDYDQEPEVFESDIRQGG